MPSWLILIPWRSGWQFGQQRLRDIEFKVLQGRTDAMRQLRRQGAGKCLVVLFPQIDRVAIALAQQLPQLRQAIGQLARLGRLSGRRGFCCGLFLGEVLLQRGEQRCQPRRQGGQRGSGSPGLLTFAGRFELAAGRHTSLAPSVPASPLSVWASRSASSHCALAR